MVEAKIGNAELTAEQIEKYRILAKSNGLDCLITISNQFATAPSVHPLEDVRKSKSKIPVFHWSWMSILTAADLLLSGDAVVDDDQKILLKELHRFLIHESAGVRGFERMPSEWGELNKLISAGGKLPAKSDIANVVISAWHQETKDLSLILSRRTESFVSEKISRRHQNDPSARTKDEMKMLREESKLQCALDVSGAAAPLDIVADIAARRIEVGMTIKAPSDKVTSKARVNWLLRQIRTDQTEGLNVRLFWPGRSDTTQHSIEDLRNDSAIVEVGKEKQQVRGLHVFMSQKTGGRFAQRSNFISDLEEMVPMFYREVGQNLTAWRRPAPRIRQDSELVSVEDVEDLDGA